MLKLSKIDKNDFVYYLIYKRSLSKNTVRLCSFRFNVFKNWMIENNRKLDGFAIEAFLANLINVRNLQTNSIRSYYYFLYQFERYCYDRGLISETFMDNFRCPPKMIGIIDVLSVDEIERIIKTERHYAYRNNTRNNNLGFFYSTFITFLALTGCRFSEVSQLRVKQLNFDQDKVTIRSTKTKSNRTLFFTEPLKSNLMHLVANKSNNDYVFSYNSKKSISHPRFCAELKKRCEIAGIQRRVHPHLFRHSFATELLSSGVEISWVASLLGHRHIDTTYQIYIHLADFRRREAQLAHPLIKRQKSNHQESSQIVSENIDMN